MTEKQLDFIRRLLAARLTDEELDDLIRKAEEISQSD
jgi:hypothetical protein